MSENRPDKGLATSDNPQGPAQALVLPRYHESVHQRTDACAGA